MSRFSLNLDATRLDDSISKRLIVNAGFTVDLDWLQSEKLQRKVLSGLCLILVALMFMLSLSAALRLKMHSEIPIWVAGAVPPALSRVAYGHDRHYMSLKFVHNKFFEQLKGYDADHVNAVISNILTTYPTAPDHFDQILGGDDKGIVVMTEIAFRLFGFKVEGVFYLYYLFLGLSAALFAYSYIRNPFALLFLASFLLIHRMILPMIKYDGQLVSITALRCMPVLAMIACMHCLLFLFDAKASIQRVIIVVLQIALIVFVMHIRSTTMWELYLVAGCSLFAYAFRKGPVIELNYPKSSWITHWPSAVPLLAAVLLNISLNLHRAYGFPEVYHRGGEIITRPFWHNIYSGLAYHPNFAKRYELRIDDFTVILATKQYLLENGRANDWEATGGNTPDYKGMRWKAFDNVVKEMFFRRCTQYFLECFTTFLYYKPLSMLKNVLWVYGLIRLPPDMDIFVSKFPEIGTVVKQQFIETSRQLDKHRERGRPWIYRLLAIAALFAALVAVRRRYRDFFPVLATSAILVVGSTAPSIIGYPAPHTIAEAALAFPLLLVVLPAYLFLMLFRPLDTSLYANKSV